MIEFKVDIPGSFTIVDHSLFRAFNKGALGQLVVEGEDHPEIMTKKLSDEAYKVLAQQQVQLLVLLVLQLLQPQLLQHQPPQPQVLPILMAVKKVINS